MGLSDMLLSALNDAAPALAKYRLVQRNCTQGTIYQIPLELS
jgi:hypothetical protein